MSRNDEANLQRFNRSGTTSLHVLVDISFIAVVQQPVGRVWMRRTLEFRDCALLANVFCSDRHCGSSDPGNGVATRGV
jgi:hypothetical protein